ncbi:uncharacterized protein LOC128092726 [Culex pipiens pallens]|uniref:uncharacterized protein LOC128092726 n=1 Tax=Culex pipiens pallens TaxID=42434 RepID=UPI0022AAB4F3|nr:uncharacterized protein LOC128092726 [Culex pipiens pallens]
MAKRSQRPGRTRTAEALVAVVAQLSKLLRFCPTIKLSSSRTNQRPLMTLMQISRTAKRTRRPSRTRTAEALRGVANVVRISLEMKQKLDRSHVLTATKHLKLNPQETCITEYTQEKSRSNVKSATKHLPTLQP